MEVLLMDLLLYIQENYIDILFGVILIISTLVIFSILNDRDKSLNDYENNVGNVQKNDLMDIPANKSKGKFIGKTVTF